jgi:hypothetical protein
MRLRRKLGASAGADSPIEAVRGFGYRYRNLGREAETVHPGRYDGRAAAHGER